MKTVIIKIQGMHCGSCAMNIDFELEDLDGVKEAATNYAHQQTKVAYDPKKVDLKKIIETIELLNYKTQITNE